MAHYGLLILHYILKALIETGLQLFTLLGPLLLLAIIMHFISKANENLSYKVWGEKGYLYIFGWLGTTIHELGHALFCIVFLHKITELKLFSVNPKNGTLGQVVHSYDKKSIYQNIGNFFIGIGPILLGSLSLMAITWLLFGIPEHIKTIEIQTNTFTSLTVLKITAVSTWHNLVLYVQWVIHNPSITWWKITIVAYFLYSVGSSITLSPSDLKSAWYGLLFFILFLFIFNILTIWIGSFTLDFFKKTEGFLSSFYFLIVLSIIVNIIFICFLIVANLVKTIITGK
jgi:hypothetical protein